MALRPSVSQVAVERAGEVGPYGETMGLPPRLAGVTLSTGRLGVVRLVLLEPRFGVVNRPGVEPSRLLPPCTVRKEVILMRVLCFFGQVDTCEPKRWWVVYGAKLSTAARSLHAQMRPTSRCRRCHHCRTR